MDMPLPFVLGCLHVRNRDKPWDATMADLECHSGERVGLHRAQCLYLVLRFINMKSGAATDFLKLSPLQCTHLLSKTNGYHVICDLLTYNNFKCGLSL